MAQPLKVCNRRRGVQEVGAHKALKLFVLKALRLIFHAFPKIQATHDLQKGNLFSDGSKTPNNHMKSASRTNFSVSAQQKIEETVSKHESRKRMWHFFLWSSRSFFNDLKKYFLDFPRENPPSAVTTHQSLTSVHANRRAVPHERTVKTGCFGGPGS